jgi:hypothetical protein
MLADSQSHRTVEAHSVLSNEKSKPAYSTRQKSNRIFGMKQLHEPLKGRSTVLLAKQSKHTRHDPDNPPMSQKTSNTRIQPPAAPILYPIYLLLDFFCSTSR